MATVTPTKAEKDKADEKEKEVNAAAEAKAAKEKKDAEAKAAKVKAETEKKEKKEAAARTKAEAEAKARKARIDSGDLVVNSMHEHEATTRETKTSKAIEEIIKELKRSEYPVVFVDAVSKVGAKYPEDLLPAMHALEYVGLVKRFDARSTAEGAPSRRTASYLWIG